MGEILQLNETCPDCLHPGWAHAEEGDDRAGFAVQCIGQNCDCTRRSRRATFRGEPL